MNVADLAQPGVITDPTPHVEFVTMSLRGQQPPSEDQVAQAMKMIANIRKSIGQKDATSKMTVTVGFGPNGWTALFPDRPVPAELHPFIERRDGDRHFPSTPGDIFFMIKSTRLDLNFQVAKHLTAAFGEFADITDDVQGYKYLDDRDLIDFVDGTENPVGPERVEAVLVSGDGPDAGGSYLIVQKYVHKSPKWDAQSTSEQEGVIGRTKFDDLELPDDEKKPYAHNVKSKVKVDGVEVKMLRQNRAFGTAQLHGTMFVGFAASPSVIETSLKQMIIADEDGYYDHLLDFTDAVAGTNYFVPPQSLLDEYA